MNGHSFLLLAIRPVGVGLVRFLAPASRHRLQATTMSARGKYGWLNTVVVASDSTESNGGSQATRHPWWVQTSEL